MKGQFLQPSDIVFDNAGNLYILDSGNKRVQIFDNSDNYLYSFNVEADNLLSIDIITDGNTVSPLNIKTTSGLLLYKSSHVADIYPRIISAIRIGAAETEIPGK